MQIGKLDERVELQSLSEANDGGELIQAYTPVQTVWADVISQRGNESFEAARTNARETIRVKMRHRNDVIDEWRIRWNSQTYNITYIDRSQRRDGLLWLTCEVVGAE